MAIYEISATTRTTATPDQVWAVLDDFAGWSSWMPSMRNVQVELQSSGEPRPGYQFRVAGFLVYADLEVTGFTKLERRTSFRLNIPPLTGENSCVMVPLVDGCYRIKRIDQIYLPRPLAGFLDRTQRERFERLAREFLISLRRTAEERAANGTRLTATTD